MLDYQLEKATVHATATQEARLQDKMVYDLLEVLVYTLSLLLILCTKFSDFRERAFSAY